MDHNQSNSSVDFHINTDNQENMDGLQLVKDINKYLRKALKKIDVIQNVSSSLNDSNSVQNVVACNEQPGNSINESFSTNSDYQIDEVLNNKETDSELSNIYLVNSDSDMSVETDKNLNSSTEPVGAISPIKAAKSRFFNLGVPCCKTANSIPPEGVKCYCLNCRLTGNHVNSDSQSTYNSIGFENGSVDNSMPVIYTNMEYMVLMRNLPPTAQLETIQLWLGQNSLLDGVINISLTPKEVNNSAVITCSNKQYHDALLQMSGSDFLSTKHKLQITSLYGPLVSQNRAQKNGKQNPNLVTKTHSQNIHNNQFKLNNVKQKLAKQKERRRQYKKGQNQNKQKYW